LGAMMPHAEVQRLRPAGGYSPECVEGEFSEGQMRDIG
jgi:hypothetical protein